MKKLLQKYAEHKVNTAKDQTQKDGWMKIYFELLKLEVDENNKKAIKNLFINNDK